jgi:predicted CoA-binding protein
MNHPQSATIVEDEAQLIAIAHDLQTVAVVGIKDGRDPDAAGFTVPEMMKSMGIRIVGVNPTLATALGEPTLRSVAELPAGVDVLDVFRRADAIPALTDEILALPPERRPPVVWLQSGIRDDASARRLVHAGVRVVQDHCLGVYVRRARRSR